MLRPKEAVQSCLESESAYCTAACPFHLDMRDFMEKMRRSAFSAAFRSLRNAVVFPRIVSELCDGRCRPVCPREGLDAAPDIPRLEKAAVAYAASTTPGRYSHPNKNARIAVVGAGPSGLACASRLESMHYDVTVFERTARIGGHLWDILSPDVFLRDFDEQFSSGTCEFVFNTEIVSLDPLSGFGAVYIATGPQGERFSLSCGLSGAFATDKSGVFMADQLSGSDSIQAIADGAKAAYAIERYIKTGAVDQPPDSAATGIWLDPAALAPAAPVYPADGACFTREEAAAEASRCIRCSCDACIRHCDLMSYYRKYPGRISDEVAQAVDPVGIKGEETHTKRLIASCNQCGMCESACPQHIDMGALLLESRNALHKKKMLPWAYHDYWLRDMRHALSGEAALARMPSGASASEYAFFPGCQLGASDPAYVSESYRYLRTVEKDAALWLGCCGAPAVWAGDEALAGETFEALRLQWKELGKPKLLFACPTCKRMFRRYLPEIAGIFLFEYMKQHDFIPMRDLSGHKYNVFDPCSSRYAPGLRGAVRELAQDAGAHISPLYYEGERAKCCSWGGHASIANPEYTGEVTRKRVTQSDLPYITYCVNCRDIFAQAGKGAVHILDVLFDLNNEERRPPGCSERRDNRVKLRQSVLY